MSRNRSAKKYSQTELFKQEFFTRIPPQTAATFTNAQLAELKKVFGNRVGRRHAVDIRLSIPFSKKRFYVVFLIGREKYSKQRLKNPSFTPVNVILLIISALVLIVFLLSVLYITEIVSGINTFPDQEIQSIVKYLTNN